MIVRIARVKVGNRQAPFAHMNPRQRPLAGVLCFGAAEKPAFAGPPRTTGPAKRSGSKIGHPLVRPTCSPTMRNVPSNAPVAAKQRCWVAQTYKSTRPNAAAQIVPESKQAENLVLFVLRQR